MSEFDYRKFLAENKLTKVSKGRETGKAKILSEGIQIREGFDMDVDTEMDEVNAQKDAYFKRKEREKRGNWGGSVGAFVEKHGEDLGRVGTNRQALVDYIETTMKPELNDEAKAYVDNLVATTKSSFKLLQALYNATMAGSGLSTSAGSLREASGIKNPLSKADIEAYREWQQENGWDDKTIDAAIEIWKQHPDMFAIELENPIVDDLEAFVEEPELYLSGDSEDLETAVKQNIYSRGLNESITVSKKYPQEKGSRTSVTSRKYKGKKAGDGQDRMAKSEMTGEKMDVTIGGVTKSISTRAYNKYRKMTDPEEKKAWKKKYGFISEGRVSRDRKRLLKEAAPEGGYEYPEGRAGETFELFMEYLGDILTDYGVYFEKSYETCMINPKQAKPGRDFRVFTLGGEEDDSPLIDAVLVSNMASHTGKKASECSSEELTEWEDMLADFDEHSNLNVQHVTWYWGGVEREYLETTKDLSESEYQTTGPKSGYVH